mmetsp:Transcript_141785/g.250526  ORF Transcript_141785/g.250526 Transcript_141785/m.250526 type:complete len:641 (+) Transcript_141785:352-2274(+)
MVIVHEDHKLFVGQLPDDVTEDELRQVFSTYGEVTRVHVMYQKKKDNLMAGFVHYQEKEAGDDAIKVLHNIYKIREDAEKAITVAWAFDLSSDKDYHKLFVGNIPEDVTEGELTQVFSTYGNVAKVHFAANIRHNGTKAALVMYTEEEAAADAIKVLDKIYKIRVDAEVPITVKWANDGSEKGYKGYNDKHGDKYKQDDKYNDRGGDYDGKYDDRWSDKHAETTDTNRGDRGHGTEKRYDKSWSYSGDSPRGAAARERTPRGGTQPADASDPHKLFVGNLPSDIQEDELFKVFGTYGDVRKVSLLTGENKDNLRCAFVFYHDHESCEDAIKVLNDIYKIREDAEYPIKVRWSNSVLNTNKGKGTGRGKDSYDYDSRSSDKGRERGARGRSQPRGGWSGWDDKSSKESRSWDDKSGRWNSDRWDAGRDRERDRDRGRDQDWGGKASSSSWGGNSWNDTSWPNNGWSSSSSSWRREDSRGQGGREPERSDYRRSDYPVRDNRDDYRDSRPDYRDSRNDYRDDRNDYRGDNRRAADRDAGDDRQRARGGETYSSATRLFVGCLPPDIKDAAVEYVFSTYGKVINIHIMSKKNADGHVAALVDYRDVEDADTAILSLNNKYEIRPGYGPLQVRKANPSNRFVPY